VGRLWGSWLGVGRIGWFDDQVVVMTVSAHGAQADSADADWLASGPVSRASSA
jgi:hypothetical protein